MYIMNYSPNIGGLVDTDRKVWTDDIKQIMLDAKLADGSYVQLRDDDGDAFRLVVKNGDIKQISPKWDM